MIKLVFSPKSIVFICAQLFLLTFVYAQQQPSIQNNVIFNWTGPQPNNNDPAEIVSIEVNGNLFDLFVVPSTYQMTQLGPGGHGPNRIRENGAVVLTGSNNAAWNATALSAFQDKNLNHYFEANPNGANICNNFGAVPTTNAQKQSLIYSPGIPVNDGGIVAVTERGGNNCFHIAVFGTPAGGGATVQLGQTFVRNSGNYNGQVFGPPLGTSDYWRSGRTNENNQTIAIALFYLDSLAPPGSLIERVQLTAATNDHGDGKFFILQDYAVPDDDTAYINSTLYDNVGDNDNVPVGSVYSVTSPPTPGGALSFNPDGSFTYTPPVGFTGIVTFNYEVCLPFPNADICDEALVVIYVLPNAGPDQMTCLGASVTMGANGTGVWSAEPGNPGTSTIANPTSPTTTISNFSAVGTYLYNWTSGPVSDQAAVVVVTVPPLPSPIGIGCE